MPKAAGFWSRELRLSPLLQRFCTSFPHVGSRARVPTAYRNRMTGHLFLASKSSGSDKFVPPVRLFGQERPFSRFRPKEGITKDIVEMTSKKE